MNYSSVMNRQRNGKSKGLRKGSRGNNSKVEGRKATTKNDQSATEIGTKYFPLTLEACAEASKSASNGRLARRVIVAAVDDTLDKINEVIINKTMRLFKLSLLYNLSLKKNFLNKLSMALTHQIQKKNIFIVDEPAEVAGTRKVNIVPLVTSDQKEIAGILLTVELVPDYEELVEEDEEVEDRPKKYDFWGVLCRDLDETYNNDSENVISMPVFMVKGNVSVTNLILQYFSKAFDCTIREMKLSPVALAWLAAMWSAYPADIPNKNLTLKYVPPKDAVGLDKIGYTIHGDNVHDLWNSVHNKDSNVLLLEEKKMFIFYLEQHFKDYMNIHLSKMRLQEIDTKSIYAKSEGAVKLYSHDTAEVIINHLTILAKRRKF